MDDPAPGLLDRLDGISPTSGPPAPGADGSEESPSDNVPNGDPYPAPTPRRS